MAASDPHWPPQLPGRGYANPLTRIQSRMREPSPQVIFLSQNTQTKVGTVQRRSRKITLNSSFDVQLQPEYRANQSWCAACSCERSAGSELPSGRNISSPALFLQTQEHTVKKEGSKIARASQELVNPWIPSLHGMMDQSLLTLYFETGFLKIAICLAR